MNEKKQPNVRFDGFTDDWEQRKLKSLVQLVVDNRGKTPVTQESGNHPLLEVNSLGEFSPNYDKVKKYVSDSIFSSWFRKYLRENDVLFSTVGNTGLTSLMDKNINAAIAQNIVAFRFASEVYPAFAVQMFKQFDNLKKAKRIEMGAVQPSIKVTQLIQVKYTIPSFEEQLIIGKFLKSIDQLIASNQHKLDELKKIKKMFMQKIFDQEWRFKGFTDPWEQYKFFQLTTSFSGLTYSPKNIQNSGTLVLRSSNIQDNEIVDADNVFVNDDVVSSKNIQKNDVIVVVRNGSRHLIGKHALVKKEMEKTVIGAFMTGLRGANGPFINALLSTDKFKAEVNKSLGATINQITGKDFELMKFYAPKNQEQNTIGQLFVKFDSLIASNQEKLEQLKQLKKWFMQNMFV